MKNQELSVVELEEFAFDLVNQLYDEYGLEVESYTQKCRQIQDEMTVDGMKLIIRGLQTVLLECMRLSIPQ